LITLVPVDRVDNVWPHVRPALHGACLRTGGDVTASELWQGCRSGGMFLIVAYDDEVIRGASVWRPETWASGGKLRCMGLAGSGMKDWIAEMHDMARKLAVDCGASSIIAEGRKGWASVFPKARVLRVLYEEAV
jgi:hypothetical protein